MSLILLGFCLVFRPSPTLLKIHTIVFPCTFSNAHCGGSFQRTLCRARGGPPPTLLLASKHRSAALPTQCWWCILGHTRTPTHSTLLVVAYKHPSAGLPTQRWWCTRLNVCASAVRSCYITMRDNKKKNNTTHKHFTSLCPGLRTKKSLPKCILGHTRTPTHSTLLVVAYKHPSAAGEGPSNAHCVGPVAPPRHCY